MPAFVRYIGIHYSGAETARSGLKALRVYLVVGDAEPVEVLPPPSARRCWTRRGVAEWLVERLNEDAPTLVGIDHPFSFPIRYFEEHGLPPDWPSFLDDFQRHWPTNEGSVYVDFVRDGSFGDGASRWGDPRWRRLTDEHAGLRRSVFQFEGLGALGKVAHAVHFWPFDGWDIPAGRSAIVEVSPGSFSGSFAVEGRTRDQHAAFSIAALLARADGDGRLGGPLRPELLRPERTVAEV